MARSAGTSSPASSVAMTATFQAPSGSRTSSPLDLIASRFSPRAKRRTSWPARAIAPPKYPPTPPAPTTATLMKPARLGDHIHRIVQESVFRGHPEERSDEGSALVGRSSRSPRLSRLRADRTCREDGDEQGPQRQPRAMKTDLDCRAGQGENLGRLFRRELFDVPQDEHRPVRDGQIFDRRSNPFARLAGEERTLGGDRPLFNGRCMVPGLVEAREIVLDRSLRAAGGPAQLHQGGVDHDPMEPGRETASSTEAVEATERREEGFLHGVLRILGSGKEVPRGREQPCAEAPHQLFVGLLVTGAQALHEAGFLEVQAALLGNLTRFVRE